MYVPLSKCEVADESTFSINSSIVDDSLPSSWPNTSLATCKGELDMTTTYTLGLSLAVIQEGEVEPSAKSMGRTGRSLC